MSKGPFLLIRLKKIFTGALYIPLKIVWGVELAQLPKSVFSASGTKTCLSGEIGGERGGKGGVGGERDIRYI